MYNTIGSVANRTLKESDINIEMSQMNETNTMHEQMNGLKNFQLQSNPSYPGQIFFVDNPQTLELLMNDPDSSSDDSHSSDSGNCSDDIGPSEFEENFDLRKMDKHERVLMKKIEELQRLYLKSNSKNAQ